MIKNITMSMLLAALIIGCNSHPSPREVTIEFVGSVIDDDSLAIEELLDVDLMIEKRLKELPVMDSTLTPKDYRDRIMKNLTGEGGTRAYWSEHRLVVNDEVVNGDTAYVEFTLMDQEYGGIQYLTIYLYRSPQGNWRVFKYL